MGKNVLYAVISPSIQTNKTTVVVVVVVVVVELLAAVTSVVAAAVVNSVAVVKLVAVIKFHPSADGATAPSGPWPPSKGISILLYPRFHAPKIKYSSL
jgi:hypothetical protein